MAKLTAVERTTQALLKRLKYCVDNYTPEEWRTTTKERLEWQYEVAKHVSETLRLNEVLLIYYLRNSQFGETNRFMKIAKKLCEANQELEIIKSIKSASNKGKRRKTE